MYSPGVCEHFEEGPSECLIEARRILKAGGILAVSTPCFNAFHRMLVRFGGLSPEPVGSFYQYAFSPRGMTGILTGLGFEVLQTRPYGTLLTLTTHLPALARVRWGMLGKPLAVALDNLPVTRAWGYSCLWIARRK